MKIPIIIILGILLLITVGATEYKTDFDFDEDANIFLYCEQNTTTACGSSTACNLTVLNVTNYMIARNVPMQNNTDGYYNYSFGKGNLSGGRYSGFAFCYVGPLEIGQATFEFTVGEYAPFGFWLWVMLLALFLGLLIFGFVRESHFLVFFAGMMAILMGIYIFSEGLPIYDVTTWWIYPLAWIFTGMGIILTVATGYEMIEDIGGEE